MYKFLKGAVLASALVFAGAANAHFQLVYTPEVNLEKAGNVPFQADLLASI